VIALGEASEPRRDHPERSRGILLKKTGAKLANAGAARESSPKYLRSKFKVGDRVRVIDVPDDLKDADFDRKHDDGQEWKLRTGELFRFCLGRVFTVYGFGRYGHVELEVGRNRGVRKKFGWSDTIWIEPEFLKLVRSERTLSRTRG
jgi:hypothetical protein